MIARFAAPEGTTPLGDEVVEVSLLVPYWQAAMLEKLADSQGLTTAQLLRRLTGHLCEVESHARVANNSSAGFDRLKRIT